MQTPPISSATLPQWDKGSPTPRRSEPLPAPAPHLSVPLHLPQEGFLVEEPLQPLLDVVVAQLLEGGRSLSLLLPRALEARGVHNSNGGHGEVLGGEGPGKNSPQHQDSPTRSKVVPAGHSWCLCHRRAGHGSPKCQRCSRTKIFTQVPVFPAGISSTALEKGLPPPPTVPSSSLVPVDERHHGSKELLVEPRGHALHTLHSRHLRPWHGGGKSRNSHRHLFPGSACSELRWDLEFPGFLCGRTHRISPAHPLACLQLLS